MSSSWLVPVSHGRVTLACAAVILGLPGDLTQAQGECEPGQPCQAPDAAAKNPASGDESDRARRGDRPTDGKNTVIAQHPFPGESAGDGVLRLKAPSLPPAKLQDQIQTWFYITTGSNYY